MKIAAATYLERHAARVRALRKGLSRGERSAQEGRIRRLPMAKDKRCQWLR